MDDGEEIIVHADEVDETGADVSVLSASTDAELTSQVEERSQEMSDLGGPRSPIGASSTKAVGGVSSPGPLSPLSPMRPILGGGGNEPSSLPVRPILSGNETASAPPPPPPKQPPPQAPLSSDGPDAGGAGDDTSSGRRPPTDSLSLAQLKNIVSNFQRMEPTAYAYTYADTRSFAEEIEEWFQYTVEDRALLRDAHAAFDGFVSERYQVGGGGGGGGSMTHSWSTWSPENREDFVNGLARDLHTNSSGNDGDGGGDGDDDDEKQKQVNKSLMALGYIAMGGWFGAFSDAHKVDAVEELDFEPPNDRFKKNVGHIHSIRESCKLLCTCGALETAWRVFLSTCRQDDDIDRRPNGAEQSDEPSREDETRRRRSVSLTILYFVIESGRWYSNTNKDYAIRDAFAKLDPPVLGTMCEQVARVRWDEDYDLQLTRAVQVLWKGILLLLGSTEDLNRSKHILSSGGDNKSTGATPPNGKPQSVLTTTPLDYHMFRQEITSKYPSYNPPPPLLPLEPENTSLLPPVPRTARSNSQVNMNVEPAKFSKSIFEQPVHITTPVPSPPPSPAGPGGKGGKKQNYQTNQHFPFLYPPLDSNSNDLGGKGGVALQDKLVGKKWKGGDVPASIREAGELFASRMRMSRPTRQLWEAREACIKYDRGWGGPSRRKDAEEEELEDLEEDLEEWSLEDGGEDFEDILKSFSKKSSRKSSRKPTPPHSTPPERTRETDDPTVQRQLDAAEAFYRSALPHLQSIIIVCLKILLANISATGVQNGSNQPSPAMPQFPIHQNIDETQLARASVNLVRQLSGASSGGLPPQDEAMAGSFEALNSTRIREITSKAIAGLLLTMLKWFRFSHVLKFQLMTQLLLDSNYLPLALKYFAMQDVDRAVDRRTDNERLGFFEFCREDAGISPSPKLGGEGADGDDDDGNDDALASGGDSPPDSSEEDEAQPPPIRRRKSAPSPPPPGEDIIAAAAAIDVSGTAITDDGTEPADQPSPPGSPGSSSGRTPLTTTTTTMPGTIPGGKRARKPEVDELGYPTTALPPRPLTTYSARFFFSTIALLRILQKIAKGHAHRALLLVQYKSSTILRRALKVPQPALRLYTLKLFKGQVPYCGRKWRQANMRVITAIYVFCRMGLRDDWISGAAAVDEWVEGALVTEQAWRGLVGWWHSTLYRDAVGLGPRQKKRRRSGGKGEQGRRGRKDGVKDADVGGHDEDYDDLESSSDDFDADPSDLYDDDDDDDDDFFMRELEKLGWTEHGLDGPGGGLGDEDEEEVEEEPQSQPLHSQQQQPQQQQHQSQNQQQQQQHDGGGGGGGGGGGDWEAGLLQPEGW